MDRLVCHPHGGGRRDRLTRAEVPDEPWVRAARDLDLDTMASSEALSGGPQRESNLEGAVIPPPPATRVDALDPVTHVRRAAGLVHIAQADERVEVLEARRQEDPGLRCRRSRRDRGEAGHSYR